MKLLFCSRPAHGHIYPMVPLANAARDAGHEVIFATGPSFVPTLEAAGFRTLRVGVPIQDASRQVVASGMNPIGPDGRTDLSFGGRVFIDVLARRTVDDLLPVIEQVSPDAVVYGQFEFGAPIAAILAGVPAVCHGVSPQMPAEARAAFVGDRLDELWMSYTGHRAAFDAFVGAEHLDIVPARIQQPSFVDRRQGRTPMRPVPWNEPRGTVVQPARDRTRPLVYLTLGTMVASDAALRSAIDGLRRLDVDIVVALGSAIGADIGRVPDHVRIEPFVDQAALMPYVDLAVHHGGSGTVFAALALGIPQVIVPKGADQFVNADLLAAAGLAPVIMPADADPDTIAAAVATRLADPDRSLLDAVRDEVQAMPHPSAVVADLADRFG